MSSTIDSPKSVASIRKLTSGKKASYEAVWFDKRTQADSHEPNEATPDVQMGDSYRELSETPSKVRQSLAGKQHVVSKLQEIDDLDHAREYFKMVLLLAFRESSRIMKESCSNHGQEYVADKKARKHLQYQMAHNTLLIAALRCVMVEKYGRAELYGHAIALCVGVLEQGLDHQSIQEYIETVVSKGSVPLAGMVQVVRDRIKMAQDRFEERKNLLETIENLQNDSRCNRAIDQKNLNSHFSKLNDKRSAGIALGYIKDSILVFKLFEGSLPAETHRDHSLMGLAYRLEGRLEDALMHYKTAASMLHGTDTDSLCLALILNDIGVIRMIREEIDVAVQAFSQAVDAYRNVPPKKAKPCSMRVSLGLTQTLKNLGHCYVKLHQYKDAKGAYQSALEFQLSARRMQTTVTMSPVEESRLLKWVGVDEIHDTFRRLGRMNSFIGLYQDCLATFTNAIVDYHHHVVEEDPNYMPKHGPIVLVKTLLSTAEACSDFGQYARALGIYSQIQNIATRFERENDCQVFLPMSCFGLASVHVRRLAYEDAHKLYKRALNLLDTELKQHDFGIFRDHLKNRIVETCKKISMIQKDVSGRLCYYEEIAALAAKQRAFKKACTAFSSIYHIRRNAIARLNQSSVDVSEETKAFLLMLQSYESVLRLTGDERAANRASREATEISGTSASIIPRSFFGALEEGRGEFSLDSCHDKVQVVQPFDLQRALAHGGWR